jgi:hypothetical protein
MMTFTVESLLAMRLRHRATQAFGSSDFPEMTCNRGLMCSHRWNRAYLWLKTRQD